VRELYIYINDIMTREQATGTLFSESQAFPQPNWLVDVVGGRGGRDWLSISCTPPGTSGPLGRRLAVFFYWREIVEYHLKNMLYFPFFQKDFLTKNHKG
jgi:hypothetical protein